ncbi:polysaccharide deacetylase family protein [Brevibacterium sp. UBA7493]|uniref:polysaccharide deacetylase family protein n=1 Tax=Brevibacterium sp. UBA7493 TaxID=1946121 RepID=UPI00257AC9FD|nr:polysaccharide deacetylase family protein [Brevibacterium sp. UBA7493]
MTSRQRLATLAACTTVGLGALTVAPAAAHTLLHDTHSARTVAAGYAETHQAEPASHSTAERRESRPETEPEARLGDAGDKQPDTSRQPELTAPQETPTRPPGELGEKAPAASGVAPGKAYAAAAEDYAYPAADVSRWLHEGSEAKGYPDEKIVFLTFDDGPTEQTTKNLKVLSDHDVHATFFQVGKQINNSTAPIVREVIDQGSAVAIHSHSHDYKRLYPGKQAAAGQIGRDYDRAVKAVRGVLGEDYASTAYRYPGGHMSWKNMQAADAALADRGATWVDWSTVNGDAEPASRRPHDVAGQLDRLAQRRDAEQNPNVEVVLMHDAKNKQLTTKALPAIIKHYQDAGYRFGIIG